MGICKELITSRLCSTPERSGRLRRGFALLFACLLVAPALCAESESAAVLRTVGAIRNVTQAQVQQSLQAHVHAVVTYYDNVSPNLFVQDETGGIWVDMRGVAAPPPRPGEFIDLVGAVDFGFSPYIAHPQWTVAGEAPFPKPIPLVYERAATGSFDAQWVEMDGVVRSFVQQVQGDVLIIDVATPTGAFKVKIPDYRSGFPLHLVDAKVRIEGVCSSDFNQRNQLVAFHLLVPSLDHLKVLVPQPANPFGIGTSPISSIRRFSGDLPDVHRVKVVGIVTARFPGKGLYVMDATGGMYVETQDGSPVQPGDEVEVLGFPEAGDYSPVLKSGSIRMTGKHSALMAMDLTGRAALKGGADAQLVRIRSTVRSVHTHGDNLVFGLETPDHVSFDAVLPKPAAQLNLPQPGSTVVLTGICSVKTDGNGNPELFEIVLSDPGNIRVVASPPWLTAGRALKILSLLALLAISGVVWVAFLRRQVNRQTAIIERNLKAKASLEERYLRIFQRNITGLYVAHVSGSIVDCNDACARILGFADREDLMENRAAADEVTQQLHLVTNSESLTEHRFQRRDGTWAWALSSARVVSNGDGVQVIEGALLDITDRKLAAERIQVLAYYDSLTGLPNRSLLQDRLSHSIAGARRRKERIGLLFLDVDAFKTINDSLGHSQGDLLLEAIAERLKACAREQDTVARLGGDEFVIVVDGVKDPAETSLIAERVFREMSTGFTIGDRTLNVTCSIGISMFPEHGEDVETLIKHGDAAMFSAKAAGRNTFRFFTEEMTAQAIERLTLESNLRAAMKNGELFVVYQPEFEIATGRIACCEALLRWKHPDVGFIPPDRFIPVAESTGMIVAIGEWVLRKACEQAKAFHEHGLISGPIAVNVSAVQIRNEDFCTMVRKVLQETGLAARLLELEITESLLLSRDESIFAILNELRSIGVSLAIDDFGTGYSSLGYLKQFPVDKLKIDRSFIQGAGTNPDDAAILAAVVQMAQVLRLKVTAEGVETEAQLNNLRELGCDQVQGYLLCKPVLPEEFPANSSMGFRYFASAPQIQ